MRVDKFIYGVIVFLVFVTMGLLIFYGEGVGDGRTPGVIDNYEVDISSNKFGNISRDMTKITNITIEQKAIMESLEGAEGTGALEKLFSGAYAAVRLIPRIFGFAASSMGSIIHEFHIPPIFIFLGAAGMLTGLVWAMIYLVFRFKPRND